VGSRLGQDGQMSVFSSEELTYLAEGKLGRLATIGPDGVPHIVPLGWTYNSTLDTIDVSGRDFAASQKFRNVKRNPNVALVVDDVLPPWQPRCVMVRGHGEAIDDEVGPDGNPTGAMIRITPTQVISFGLSTP